jgi:acyl carrier protein phosphodiesterase
MLTDDDWEPLRAAVPSFADLWRAFVAQPWYESDPSYAVSELARHLVDEAVAGRTSELPAFFAALDALLAGASDELYDLATIGLLEDVVHEADRRKVKLAPFDRAAKGGHVRKAWSGVVKFIRGETRSP